MTKEEQKIIFERVKSKITQDSIYTLLDKLCELLLSKGDDYAGSDDRLKVFKGVAELTDSKPEDVLLTMISVKVMRLSTLFNNKEKVKHESIEDSINDLLGYAIILNTLNK